MDSLILRINQSADDLINHYQLLNTHTNKLINKKQTNRIYDIFTVENDYYYLISNWGEKILKSNMIDEIYEQLVIFMPQLIITRSDITLTKDTAKVYVNIKARNQKDFELNSYNLVLFNNQE